MLHVYLAHPLSAPTREGIDQNRANAAKWAAWLWRQGFAVQCSWIVCTGELEETPENRELGLASDCAQAERCDVMALCDPRISGGMLEEAGAAKLIVDFTRYGMALPLDWLKWSDGTPMLLSDVVHRMGHPSEVLASGMASPPTADRSTVLGGPPSIEESASRIRDQLANPPPLHARDCASIEFPGISPCNCGAVQLIGIEKENAHATENHPNARPRQKR